MNTKQDIELAKFLMESGLLTENFLSNPEALKQVVTTLENIKDDGVVMAMFSIVSEGHERLEETEENPHHCATCPVCAQATNNSILIHPYVYKRIRAFLLANANVGNNSGIEQITEIKAFLRGEEK